MASFTIYPAIDMRGGKCVRLLQGDYNKETVYGDSPVAMAEQFAAQGAEWIHMVDLDGAKEGRRVNDRFVIEAANRLSVNVQVGGGIRTEEDVAYYLERGVARVILGSAAISNPTFVKKMLQTYGRRIVIGIDARDGFVATEGWLETSNVKAEELGQMLAEAGAETFIFTDIATDGTLSGPNITAAVRLAEATGKEVIASGGVRSLDDLRALREYAEQGIGGAIVGKALYTNQFTLAEALKAVNER
ncbi:MULTISPECIES: 1-(5-phosphoribosyl)-5-[(5-phosphoribosylamino)methylideneamino]imidazole-4-carboxamide isomerase [Geobacillus]|jgi:phosphoribosylformimino-5-aminoimidazole carboxamide ribotide isomerase|uniref:1-(5-phosphoribosyl)-5-[(5-phosphoribosylamino)methylideneamino] imidazole-4-carboxamide isomerase n=2 Tax=Geobacillus thermodenitrificans TaxID=33940 RepID=HIS4_GEOTN|nr:MULTISPECIES: 1-(5-phosphoribosyl)-5-[(5-phosphoribosylamino)methylideneamino]imidazole-4-carboxamide isomerase [Geobacillus]A4ISR3.1 RecName: Full=1-(5-phosphoribosyl)-5-[(5-phosphoribosylamino)methylideneamino] imidazole-4-carboxamide isomerase; AltName: Full=Phosphoribosylformimino-5-aminoimidazole carboxamide ribotide isomerase [Geobacillus thermodenitrificans NG80-2]ABO68367.1 Phosphoribosylformimino-5-aminoimidazole carboxamide ribotide isomerase [Geobacillus thermodenitrificans NG80-2]